MPNQNPTPATEELGYFYDSIHGRVALEELPKRFHPALKSALSSKSLARLKRISQLGHTSVSFFSATHTRFSHAIGTMLIMNKLFRHVRPHGLSQAIFNEAKQHYAPAAETFSDEYDMVHCHLLLAALYQDVGELPFQKVTSLYFVPVESDVMSLGNDLPKASPSQWTVKKKFSVLSLAKDMRDSEIKGGFEGYDLEFLAFLITGDGSPPGTTALKALLQMVDGVIDADRLDYVYRDASVTIGSLGRPNTVLESVVGYEPDKVIVNHPYPITDFLSTRMRLWTFVYSSADVRFRQVLLKTVLEGRWDRPVANDAFRVANLEPDLEHNKFLMLDDYSLMDRIENLATENLQRYRQNARILLLRGTLDYECRVLKREMPVGATGETTELPDSLFFDLLSDHGHHQLYRLKSIFVRQGLTSKIADLIPLEESAGAFSPLFDGKNSAILVTGGYYLFLPRQKQGGRWPDIELAIKNKSMFQLVAWEDARRSLACPTDTRQLSGFSGKAISISYCFKDFPTTKRIVRELHRLKRRYWLFLRPFDGTGGTPAENSSDLITKAEAVFAVVSTDYLERSLNGNSYINIEVGEMLGRSRDIPIVALGIHSRDQLNTNPLWYWGQMCHAWRDKTPVIPNEFPLLDASVEILRDALDKALKHIDQWKNQS